MSDEVAIGDQLFSSWMNLDFNPNLTRLAPIELERRQEVNVFDRLHVPVREQALGGFGEDRIACRLGRLGLVR